MNNSSRLTEVVDGDVGAAARTGVGATHADRESRVRCARITFWGTQGSVPIAPDFRTMRDYQSRITEETVRKLIHRLRAERPGFRIEDLLKTDDGHLDRAIDHLVDEVGQTTLPLFGGETTCVSVETNEGNVLCFDGGTGMRAFAGELDRHWATRADRTLHLFFTHEHLDHRNGLPFSRLCYARPRPFKLKIYGSRQVLAALDDRYGIFTHRLSDTIHFDDPVDYRQMTAIFEATEIREAGDTRPVPWAVQPVSQHIMVGKTKVQPFDVYHGPTRCLAYKVEHEGRKFVFCTDHEIRRISDKADEMPDEMQVIHADRLNRSLEAENRLRTACEGADVAYFDAQYLLPEYWGEVGIGISTPVPRMDWGHGCIEDAIKRARECKVGRTFLGHHDPERPWEERREWDAKLRSLLGEEGLDIRLANDEESVDL